MEREDPTGQQAQGLEALAQQVVRREQSHNSITLWYWGLAAHQPTIGRVARPQAKDPQQPTLRCAGRTRSGDVCSVLRPTGNLAIRIWTSAIHGMSGHTVGVTVWGGAASTVRLRADTDSKLASDIKLLVRGAQRASSPPILDVTNQTTNVSRCLLPQQGSNIEFDIHCGSAFDTNHRSVPQQGNRSVLPPRGAQAQWQIWRHLFSSPELSDVFLPNHFPPFHATHLSPLWPVRRSILV